jgi:tetratricopeptide (TPR) repeat protein
MIMQEAGLLQQAEVHLRYCLQHDPLDATALVTLATVLAKTGRLQQAEHAFLRAVQLQPDNSSVRSNTATFYRNNRLWSKRLSTVRIWHGLRFVPAGIGQNCNFVNFYRLKPWMKKPSMPPWPNSMPPKRIYAITALNWSLPLEKT